MKAAARVKAEVKSQPNHTKKGKDSHRRGESGRGGRGNHRSINHI
jgi:hypothetical protein